MDLDASGHPLHSRALSIELRQAGPGQWTLAGSLLDLRKRSFVPVGGDLQGSGIIHHMQVDADVASADGALVRIEVQQPSVAFEPSSVTRGESCRDPVGRVQGLVGAPLDGAFARRAGAEIGGPRGCTHVLSLLQLAGSSLSWVQRREAELFAAPPRRARGERLFRRDLVFDGTGMADGRLGLTAQLTDLHFRPAPEPPRPIDRLAGQLELRASATVDWQAMQLLELRAAERRRGPDDLERAPWRDLAGPLEELPGLALRPGVSGELLRRLGQREEELPLLEVLLNLTPAFYQCLAVASEEWPREARRRPSVLGMGGLPDSCWMWRRGGALDALRETKEEASR